MKLIFNIERAEAIKRIKRVDLVCTDLDECLFPFYTQVLVVGELILEAIFKKKKWKYLFRLLFGSLIVASLILISFGKVKIFGNRFLMRIFSWTIRGIPIYLIRKHSGNIHNYFYTGSLNFLEMLSKQGSKIAILSLSIQPILNELKNNIEFIDFAVGNNVKLDVNNNFFSYQKFINSTPNDKLDRYNELLSLATAKVPLIIGHSDDEVLMARDARKRAGISIGINPKKYLYSEFDIIVEALDWSPLLNFLSEALDEQ